MTVKLPRPNTRLEEAWRMLLNEGPMYRRDIAVRLYPDDPTYRDNKTHNLLIELEKKGLARRQPTGPEVNARLLWHGVHAEKSANHNEVMDQIVSLERLLAQAGQRLANLKRVVSALSP